MKEEIFDNICNSPKEAIDIANINLSLYLKNEGRTIRTSARKGRIRMTPSEAKILLPELLEIFRAEKLLKSKIMIASRKNIPYNIIANTIRE